MILRYLLNDNVEMAETAERYLDAGEVYVTIEVIAEVIYVLKGVYLLERGEIARIIKEFVKLVNCAEYAVLNFALDTFGAHNLDFVDCVLYAYYSVQRAKIATFDKKLIKLMGNT